MVVRRMEKSHTVYFLFGDLDNEVNKRICMCTVPTTNMIMEIFDLYEVNQVRGKEQ